MVNKRKEAKQDYYNQLNAQIKLDKQRKKYDILMTEHERRVHDNTIKAYERFELEGVRNGNGVPHLGQNYKAIQQKYIQKAFVGGSGSPGSPMMNNAKRPNLNEVVSVVPGANSGSTSSLPNLSQSVTVDN